MFWKIFASHLSSQLDVCHFFKVFQRRSTFSGSVLRNGNILLFCSNSDTINRCYETDDDKFMKNFTHAFVYINFTGSVNRITVIYLSAFM